MYNFENENFSFSILFVFLVWIECFTPIKEDFIIRDSIDFSE